MYLSKKKITILEKTDCGCDDETILIQILGGHSSLRKVLVSDF